MRKTLKYFHVSVAFLAVVIAGPALPVCPSPNANPNAALKVAADFGADCQSDVLWRNSASGSNYLWQMSGIAVSGDSLPTVASTDWSIAGIGDFNGDGKADIFWRNAVTGQNYIWFMLGAAQSTNPAPGFTNTVDPASGWTIAGFGDFDGDGRTDVLWRNPSTGRNFLWLMNQLAVGGGSNFLPTVAGSAWSIAGIGDFDGDGKSDIFWRNAVTGENYIWFMNGITQKLNPAPGFTNTVAPASGWTIVGFGDFNGDGKTDVLWRNESTGQNYLWLMDSLSVTGSSGFLPGVTSTAWSIAGIGDYNGDGKSDLFWRNLGTGEDYLWFMNGTIQSSANFTNTVTDVTWAIANPATPAVVFPPGTCNNGQACSAVTIATRSLPRATAGVPYWYQLNAFGGTPPYTWAASTIYPGYFTVPMSPPNGLTLNTATGVISGTPAFSGAFPILVSVRDSNTISGYNAHIQLELAVGGTGSPLAILNTPPSPATQGTAYNFTFFTTWANYPADPSTLGCTQGLELMAGIWPAGLSANSLNGQLSGTPIFAGDYTFTFSASTLPNIGCGSSPWAANARTFTIHVNPAGSPATPPGSSNWIRGGTNPVLRPSALGWDSFRVGYPSVVKAGGTYRMYYEAEDHVTHTTRIGLATSSDGVNWTRSLQNPVLRPGAAGSWDEFTVRAPVVYFDGATYRMWYRGSNGGASGVGFASSSDGINWTKHAGNPLASWPLNLFDAAMIPGSVVWSGSQFVIWYWDGLGGIGRATSPDGLAWTNQGYVSGLAALSNGRPSVINDGGTYRIWYESLDGFVNGIAVEGLDIYNARIRYGYSANGQNWSMVTDAFGDTYSSIFVLGSANAWDRPGVGQPFVMKDGSTFRMWYVGGPIKVPYSPVEGAIGYAIIP